MKKARIVSIERKQSHIATRKDGIKKDKQSSFDNSDKYYGSNGTYMTNLKTQNYVEMKVVVYGDTKDENETVPVDIRNDILQENGKKRVSRKMLKKIQDENVGNKVDIDYSNGRLSFPEGELKLKIDKDK